MGKAFAIASILFLIACNENKPAKNDSANSKPKDSLVSIEGLWIDSSEINSNEYREFKVDSFQKTKEP